MENVYVAVMNWCDNNVSFFTVPKRDMQKIQKEETDMLTYLNEKYGTGFKDNTASWMSSEAEIEVINF